MAKRALIVGCNYPGTDATLRGCVNDAHTMQSLLTKHFGFSPGDITMMLDTDAATTKPTGANIKARRGAGQLGSGAGATAGSGRWVAGRSGERRAGLGLGSDVRQVAGQVPGIDPSCWACCRRCCCRLRAALHATGQAEGAGGGQPQW